MASALNAFTVDVEDYFHVSAFNKVITPNDWDGLESRVERNTHRLLDLLDETGTSGTFFILGWVAQRIPAIAREVQQRGHEVACHGYSHQLIYKQTQAVFRDETQRAKGILEDTIGAPVRGYRAASYSITRNSLWALDTLAELGFSYDSSIFPVRHDTYGLMGGPELPHVLSLPSGHELIEFPISTLRLFGFNVPIAGGGYFQALPVSPDPLAPCPKGRARPSDGVLHPSLGSGSRSTALRSLGFVTLPSLQQPGSYDRAAPSTAAGFFFWNDAGRARSTHAVRRRRSDAVQLRRGVTLTPFRAFRPGRKRRVLGWIPVLWLD